MNRDRENEEADGRHGMAKKGEHPTNFTNKGGRKCRLNFNQKTTRKDRGKQVRFNYCEA